MTAEAERNEAYEEPVAAEAFGDELPEGSKLLHGQYTITRFLNAGGFGITYLAQDSLDRTVVIKECFPASMCCRSSKSRTVRVRSEDNASEFQSIVRLFGQEARALAKLKHPNIVGVHQVFEDNDTAYMALDFVEGRDLLDVIEEEPHRLGPREIKDILMKCLDAVAYIHANGILHRDISPDNILLSAEGEPVLIDFGAAREEATRVSRVLSQQHTVKDGYSPQEFYISGSKQTLSSDLYALAATFHHLIVGEAPPISQARLSAVAENKRDPYAPLSGTVKSPDYDRFFLGAIDKALEVFPKDRIQTAEDWMTEIDTERRRKAAQVRAQTDKALQRAIQKLVEETNKAVRLAQEQEASEKDKPKVKVEQKKKPLFPELMVAPPPAQDDTSDAPGDETVLTNGADLDESREEEAPASADGPGRKPARGRLFSRMLNVSLRRTATPDADETTSFGKVNR